MEAHEKLKVGNRHHAWGKTFKSRCCGLFTKSYAHVFFSFRGWYMLKDYLCFIINCVEKILLPSRWEALRCWTATMPTVKKIKIYKDAVIGCSKGKCLESSLCVAYQVFCFNFSFLHYMICVCISVCHRVKFFTQIFCLWWPLVLDLGSVLIELILLNLKTENTVVK